jgi:transposase
MARALSLDLRERGIVAIEDGGSCRKAAERFGVGVATVIGWHARFRGEGEIAAKPMGGLVARTLERDWEMALAGQARLMAGYERFRHEGPQSSQFR